jgi:hypothetical protein
VVTVGVSGSPRIPDNGLAFATGFMPQFDLGLPDIATTVLVTFWYLVVQPHWRQRAADTHRTCN